MKALLCIWITAATFLIWHLAPGCLHYPWNCSLKVYKQFALSVKNIFSKESFSETHILLRFCNWSPLGDLASKSQEFKSFRYGLLMLPVMIVELQCWQYCVVLWLLFVLIGKQTLNYMNGISMSISTHEEGFYRSVQCALHSNSFFVLPLSFSAFVRWLYR